MGRVRVSVVVLLVAGLASMPAGARPSGDDWAALHRPLHLPRIAPGARCPVSPIDRRVRWRRAGAFGGTGIGRGPVYPMLGGAHGLLWATRDPSYPWPGEKVFWYVLPSYRGPVLVRGRRIDGNGTVRFVKSLPVRGELRIEASESVSWSNQPQGSRGIASGVYVRAPGCYAFQIDGLTFSRAVVFVADNPG